MVGTIDDSCVLRPGPWQHRFVSANGSRFHVAEAGTGPLVLLLHGFPEFWLAWEHQLTALADAGLRAVAVDLRGQGASDKPPRGYDWYTLAHDVAGLIRALGERHAVVVGHDLGGLIGWTAAAFHPDRIRRLLVVDAPHPLRLRSALVADPKGQLAASRHLFAFQLPRYDRILARDNAAAVGDLITRWAGPEWTGTEDFEEYVAICRKAARIPQAAFCGLEAHRWAMRTMVGLRGHRLVRLLQRQIPAPVLQLHGALDTSFLPRTAQGSGRYVAGQYEWRLLDGVGHFPHREVPETVSGEIIRWAKEGD